MVRCLAHPLIYPSDFDKYLPNLYFHVPAAFLDNKAEEATLMRIKVNPLGPRMQRWRSNDLLKNGPAFRS